jgi:hypothetical protein
VFFSFCSSLGRGIAMRPAEILEKEVWGRGNARG